MAGRRRADAAYGLLALAASLCWVPAARASLTVGGSTTVHPVVAEAAEALRAEEGLEIRVDPSGGSSGGIHGLGEGRLDIAMASRPVSADDRGRFPDADFRAVAIGTDAVALVVSREVWDGGVQGLSKQEIRGIYEGRIRRWSEVGGPDLRIALFNKEPGRGTWEVFADWLYGDYHDAPLVSHPEVGSNEETRNKVAATRGGLSQLSAAWADGERIFALAVETDDGAIAPTARNIASGRYPIGRPLLVVTSGAPRGEARALIEFLLGPRGQKLVEKHGYLPIVTSDEAAAP